MRISDWSSDVCSSDLEREAETIARAFVEKHFDAPNASFVYVQKWRDGIAVEMQEGGGKAYLPEVLAKLDEDPDAFCILPMTNRVMQVRLDADTGVLEALVLTRSEEHTSELQSLMRISSAVFCLKKKLHTH